MEKYQATRGGRPNPGEAPFRNQNLHIFHKSITVLDEHDKLLAVFIKNALPPWAVKVGREMKIFKGRSRKRCMYAGSSDGKNIYSCPIGFVYPPGKTEIMLSTTSLKHAHLYQNGVKRLYRYIDRYIQSHAPDAYKRQYQYMKRCPTLFQQSQVTTNTQVNFDQVAHFHVDSGNYNNIGSVMAFNIDKDSPFTGGEFVLGEYNIGFGLTEGDLLLVNQSELHGTLPHHGRRLSLVGFISKRLLDAYCKGRPVRKCSSLDHIVNCSVNNSKTAASSSSKVDVSN